MLTSSELQAIKMGEKKAQTVKGWPAELITTTTHEKITWLWWKVTEKQGTEYVFATFENGLPDPEDEQDSEVIKEIVTVGVLVETWVCIYRAPDGHLFTHERNTSDTQLLAMAEGAKQEKHFARGYSFVGAYPINVKL